MLYSGCGAGFKPIAGLVPFPSKSVKIHLLAALQVAFKSARLLRTQLETVFTIFLIFVMICMTDFFD